LFDIVKALHSNSKHSINKGINIISRLSSTFILCFILLSLTACGSSSVDSDKVSTSEIFPKFSALSDGTGNVTVVAQLRASAFGDSDFVKLVDGDVLLASSGVRFDEVFDTDDIFGDADLFSESLAILKKRTLNDGGIQYEFALTGIDLSLPIYIHLIKNNGTSALDSNVKFPMGFQITSPQNSSSIPRSDDINISWSNTTAEPVELEVSGTCSDNIEFTKTVTLDNTTGIHVLSSAEVNTIVNNSTSTCVLNLRIKRRSFGVISTTFVQGGVYEGIEQRVVTVTSVP